MKKINRSSELLWLLGVIFAAIGVALCNKSELGVSMIAAPAFIIADALSAVHPFFTIGAVEYLFQGLLLIVMCIAVRRFDPRYLLAFLAAVIYGYTLDLFIFLFRGITVTTVATKYILLLVGDVITGFGFCCFFRTYLPVQVYELFVDQIVKRYGFKLEKVKRCFDISLLCTAVILAIALFLHKGDFDPYQLLVASYHNIGIGTLITTLINSYILAFWIKVVDKVFEPTAAFVKLEKVLKTD